MTRVIRTSLSAPAHATLVRIARVEFRTMAGFFGQAWGVVNAGPVLLEQAADDGPGRPLVDFQSPDRILTSVLAARERALLNWLCRRLPGWVTPDRLTAVGTIGAAIASLGYVASNWRPEFLFLASVGVAVNWFGDSLDGSLARHRRIERPRYGFFLDHSVDAINILIFAAGLGLSPYVSMDAALFLLCGYYLLSIHVYLSAQINGELKLTHAYCGPTEFRLLAIAFNCLIYVVGPFELEVTGTKTSIYSLLILLEGTVLVVVAISSVYATTQKLRSLDKSRPDA
jgi:archaetidylinositol phosphate synthase